MVDIENMKDLSLDSLKSNLEYYENLRNAACLQALLYQEIEGEILDLIEQKELEIKSKSGLH